MFFELSNATVFNRTKNKKIMCYRVQISIICKKIIKNNYWIQQKFL